LGGDFFSPDVTRDEPVSCNQATIACRGMKSRISSEASPVNKSPADDIGTVGEYFPQGDSTNREYPSRKDVYREKSVAGSHGDENNLISSNSSTSALSEIEAQSNCSLILRRNNTI